MADDAYVPPTMPNWREVAVDYRDMLIAALSTGRMMAYPGVFGGKDVVVFAWDVGEQPDGNGRTAKPLAIALTPELYDSLEIPHATVVFEEGGVGG